MFNLFNFDLDSERLKNSLKDHILKIMVGFVVVMFCFIGLIVFNILRPKEQIKTDYISKKDLIVLKKDLLKDSDYQKTKGFDFVQAFFEFKDTDLSKVQKLTQGAQLQDSIKKNFELHDVQNIKSIKLYSSTEQEIDPSSQTTVDDSKSLNPKKIGIQEVYEVETNHTKYMIIVVLQNNYIERYDYVEMVH